MKVTASKTKARKDHNSSDSEYAPSDSEDDDNYSETIDQKEINEINKTKTSALKSCKVIHTDLTLAEVQDKIKELKKAIYEEYDHGKVILNFERAKL